MLLGCAITAGAQTEVSIRQYYLEINNQVTAAAEQGFEGPLYQNQLVINKNSKSWPAVGNYADTINFWYDDPPDHLPAAERNPRNTLLKVSSSAKIAAGVTIAEEYLFKNGKLVFFYAYYYEEGDHRETRVYFNTKGVAFKTVVKSNERELTPKDFLDVDYKALKPNPAKILADAKRLQDVFLASMK